MLSQTSVSFCLCNVWQPLRAGKLEMLPKVAPGKKKNKVEEKNGEAADRDFLPGQLNLSFELDSVLAAALICVHFRACNMKALALNSS